MVWGFVNLQGKDFGSCVVFVQKGKINLALRNVARHLCRPCIFFTDEPRFLLRMLKALLKIRRASVNLK